MLLLPVLVLDAVREVVLVVPARVAEELPADRHTAEVTVVLVTPVLTVVSEHKSIIETSIPKFIFIKNYLITK